MKKRNKKLDLKIKKDNFLKRLIKNNKKLFSVLLIVFLFIFLIISFISYNEIKEKGFSSLNPFKIFLDFIGLGFENAIYVDNQPSCINRDETYDPETRTCGEGSDFVYSNIQDALDNANPGDNILIRQGEYFGGLVVNNAGEENNYITIQSYPNEEAILTLGRKYYNWELENGYYVLDLSQENYVDETLRLVEKSNYGIFKVNTYEELTNPNLRDSIPQWITDDLKLFYYNDINKKIYLRYSGNPEDIYVMDSYDRFEIYHDSGFIEIKNLIIQYGYDGIKSYSPNIKIINNTIKYINGQGILSGEDNFLIQGNNITHIGKPLMYSDLGDITENGGDHCVYYSGRNSIVKDNYLEKSFGGELKLSDANWLNPNLNPGNLSVYHNIIKGRSILDGDDILFYNNIILPNYDMNYSPFAIQFPGNTKARVYNNFIKGKQGIRYQEYYTGLDDSDIEIKNNIIISEDEEGYSVYLIDGNVDEFDFSNNLYFGNQDFKIIGNEFNSFNDYKTYMNSFGLEENSFYDNPLLNNDYTLSVNSPAIDNGICLNEVDKDYLGVERPQGEGCDIGAFEFYNLIKNGQMENDFDNNGIPDYWVKYFENDNHILAWIDDPTGYGKGKILYTEYTGEGGPSWFGWEQDLDLKPDTWYEFSGEFATEGLEPIIKTNKEMEYYSDYIGIMIEYHDKNGVSIYGDPIIKSEGPKMSDWDEENWVFRTYEKKGFEPWKNFAVYFKTHPNIISATLKIRNLPIGKGYFDNFVLKELNSFPYDVENSGEINFPKYKGEDFFPIILFGLPRLDNEWANNIDLSEIKEKGFNTVQGEYYKAYELSLDEIKQEFLDNDLALIIWNYHLMGTSEYSLDSWKNDPEQIVNYVGAEYIKDEIDKWKNFENLFAINTQDERNCHNYREGNFIPNLASHNAVRDYIKENTDVYELVNFCGIYKNFMIYTGIENDFFNYYFNNSDIVSFTHNLGPAYPDSYDPTGPYLNKVGEKFGTMVSLSKQRNMEKIFLAYGLGYLEWSKWEGNDGYTKDYIPYNLQRNMIWQQIINKAGGVWFWGTYNLRLDNDYYVYHWAQISSLARELNSLYPVLLEKNFYDEYSCDNNDIEIMMKKHNNKIYLFTASKNYTDLYNITISLNDKYKIISVKSLNDVINGDFENPLNRSLNISDNSFTDDFIGDYQATPLNHDSPGYAVHIYEIEYKECSLEICDGIDNDCDGLIDEDNVCGSYNPGGSGGPGGSGSGDNPPVDVDNNTINNENNTINQTITEKPAPPLNKFSRFIKENIKWILIILLVLILLILIIILIIVRLRKRKNKLKSDYQEKIILAKQRVNQFRKRGYKDEQIRNLFLQKGWKEDIVQEILR